ncbi:MAG: DegT/DnrJ/EryC1/StrS family aminotransferase [Candidatus Marinimicrobia bacterium]|nr:DegT/DnrJ/EryC1/StrS family aminotransferase [Candidatus Neomarinimicrobiota bacterium]
MKINMSDLKKQHDGLRDDLDNVIKEVIDSNAFILGGKVTEFENDYSSFTGAKYTIGMASGTGALHVALAALDVGIGDEVITVPFTFAATLEMIHLTGAKPVLVDIEPRSFTMDVTKIEDAITDKTKVILPVHLYGQMADMDAIMELAEKYGLKVIEDAAQAQGSSYKEAHAGTIGDIGTFSFYPGKNLGAMGDAGACTTNSGALADKMRLLLNHGQSRKYEHTIVGYNYRLDTIQAAVLGVKLKELSKWNEHRNKIASIYAENLKDTGLVLPIINKNRNHVWHQYVIRTGKRDDLKEALSDLGIATALHYPVPLHLQPSFAYLGHSKGDFLVAELCSEEVLSLPIYPELPAATAVEISQEVVKICKRLGI